MKLQKGYLLILAAVLIVVIGFVSTMLVYMHSRGAQSVANVQQSHEALYLASSGLEIAKRDILVNNVTCSGINGLAKYTNAPLFNGQMTVTGSSNIASTSTFMTMLPYVTYVPVYNSNNFADQGVVQIDFELIRYEGKTTYFLLNATRGYAGSVATTHYRYSTVTQSSCTLNSLGGIPNLITPRGKRELEETLLGRAFAFPGGMSSLPNGATPGVTSAENVSLRGNANIQNPSVMEDGDYFQGANVISRLSTSLSSSSSTYVSDENGNLVTSSTRHGKKADVDEGNSDISSNNLFGFYFTADKSTIQSEAHQYTDSDNLNGITGQTMWVTVEEGGHHGHHSSLTQSPFFGHSQHSAKYALFPSGQSGVQRVQLASYSSIGSGIHAVPASVELATYSSQGSTSCSSSNDSDSNDSDKCGGHGHSDELYLNGNITIGSPSSPVIMIVDGDVEISGNVRIYGLLYVTGTLTMGGNSYVSGTVAAEGAISMSGSAVIQYNPNILTLLNIMNGNSRVTYLGSGLSVKEIFK
ncbi:MAG: hypothetical protein KKE46_01725 [Gammaproteobacteria bacterium]|nr:hypothetical protein [Gammaproteobacteria bacterium]